MESPTKNASIFAIPPRTAYRSIIVHFSVLIHNLRNATDCSECKKFLNDENCAESERERIWKEERRKQRNGKLVFNRAHLIRAVATLLFH